MAIVDLKSRSPQALVNPCVGVVDAMFDRVARGCWPVACIRFAVTIAKVVKRVRESRSPNRSSSIMV